jgi:hypothetical protein
MGESMFRGVLLVGLAACSSGGVPGGPDAGEAGADAAAAPDAATPADAAEAPDGATVVDLPPTIGPFGPDLVELEPERTVLDIALRYAPIWYHDTATGGPDGLGARADVPTSVDFDGDLRHDDNWEALVDVVPWSFIYYGLVATETHFFLTYSQYHPRDWESICSGLFTECHEGDMESVRVIVRRSPEAVVAVLSGAHNDDYLWATEEGAVASGTVELTGKVDFESLTGSIQDGFDADHSHVRLYTQEHGHGPIPCRAIETEPTLGYLGFGPDGVRCSGAAGEPGYSGGTGITFVPDGTTPTRFAEAQTSGARVGYGLVNDEATLWQWRHELGSGKLWRDDSAMTYTGARGAPEFAFAGEIGARYDPQQFINDVSSGSAPWNEDQPESNPGDLFFDPAFAFPRLYTFDHPVADVYTYNPYIYEAHATPP